MQPGIPSYTLKRNVSVAGSGRANGSLRNGFSVLVGLKLWNESDLAACS